MAKNYCFFDSYFQLFMQNGNYGVATEDKLMYARVDRFAKSYQHFINTYCNGDKNEFNQICRILENYIMRRMVVHATTKNYNNLYTSLIPVISIGIQRKLVKRITPD